MDEMIFAMSGTFSEDINQMRGAITIDGVTTCHTIMKKTLVRKVAYRKLLNDEEE